MNVILTHKLVETDFIKYILTIIAFLCVKQQNLLSLLLLCLCLLDFHVFILIHPISARGLTSSLKDSRWEVDIGDEMRFEVAEIENNTGHTLVDDIYQEYFLDEASKDIFGNTQISIRINELVTLENWTRIIEMIDSFTGPALVEQKLSNGTWKSVNKIIIPFVVPVGNWELLNESWNELLANNSQMFTNTWANYQHTWVGEEQYTIRKETSEEIFDLSITWEGGNMYGSLQGLFLSITKNGSKDQIRFGLSLPPKERQTLSTEILVIFSIFFILGGLFLGTFIFVFIQLKRKNQLKKYRTEERIIPYYSGKQQADLGEDLRVSEEVTIEGRSESQFKRSELKFKIAWLVVNVLTYSLGLLGWNNNFWALFSADWLVPPIIFLILFILSIGINVLLAYYKYRNFNRINEISPSVSFFFGFLAIFLSGIDQLLLNIQYLGVLSLLLMILVIIIIQVCFYLLFNPWSEFKMSKYF